jgi:hypothetical protein
MRRRTMALVAGGLAVLLAGGVALAAEDFGLFVQHQVQSRSEQLFGVNGPSRGRRRSR